MNNSISSFLRHNAQGIIGCATGALMVSGSLPTALFFGLCWGVGVFIAEAFIAMRNGRR